MIAKSKKSPQQIDLIIRIGDFEFTTKVLKQTTIGAVFQLIKNTTIHEKYGPQNSYFIGFASVDQNQIVDYILTQHQLNFTKFKKKLALKALYTIQKKVNEITINNFQFLKCLGKGAVGAVYLVRNRVTGYIFALKMLKKSAICGLNEVTNIINEKKIMKSIPLNHYTANFYASFESSQHFNFILDYYPGGQLFLHLSKGTLSERETKIYFCQILSSLQFLHKNGILYRDLKPENILVDLNGHLHIADFGLSKCNFKENDNALTHCGSPQYMAPEILENQQYNFACDFYSIGALLYEFLTGLPPYYKNQALNDRQRLNLMKSMPLNFKSITPDKNLRHLLQGLLDLDSDKRICNFQQIKSSAWLADIDWKKIEEKSYSVPLVPEINKEYICSEFKKLEEEVENLNRYENVQEESLQNFTYIRPEGRKILLGKSNTQAKETKQNKRKSGGFTKQKYHGKSSKANLSIALFDGSSHRQHREDTATTSHSNNTSYEPKTMKNIECKENFGFKKDSSRKNLLKHVPSSTRITTINNSHNVSECSSKMNKSKEKGLALRRNTQITKSKSKLLENHSSVVHKSKSKEKMIGQTKTKKQILTKLKKDMLPVSSMKIKLM